MTQQQHESDTATHLQQLVHMQSGDGTVVLLFVQDTENFPAFLHTRYCQRRIQHLAIRIGGALWTEYDGGT
jgi:hypothetical protein